MGAAAMGDCHQLQLVTRRSRLSSAFSSKVRFSSVFVVPAGARVFCLGMLALILALPCKYGVGASNFSFNGFKQSDVHIVSDSRWTLSTDGYNSFSLNPTNDVLFTSVAGRFLYPGLVQMTDPGTTTVKSFSTTFIYQIRIQPGETNTGPGMAFIMVPDNFTLGASRDYMGVLTLNTSATGKNYESDNHTVAVELDTWMNPEFNDTNDNHIGIDLASMNSTYAYRPTFNLASGSTDIFQQMWIEYSQTDSHMDIYIAYYGQGKPAKPQASWPGLDLSIVKKNTYVGFASAVGVESTNLHIIYAWSFSNDGDAAPAIFLAPDAPPPGPAPSPPPPAPVAPPPPPPSTPPPSTSPPANGPVAAPPEVPVPPPEVPVPPPEVPPSPSPVPTPTPLPSRNPSPLVTNYPPPPSIAPPPGPIREPTTPPRKGKNSSTNLGALVGVPVSLLIVLLCLGSLAWWKVFSRPLRIFISHTGKEDGSGKNFPSRLRERILSWRWSRSKFRVKVFLDAESCPVGLSPARSIFRELARFDVGVVVVTKEFFERKWPMTELIAFKNAQKKDPGGRVRLLPLFYELTPDDVRDRLVQRTWEGHWEGVSTPTHPLDVEECREAVDWLRGQRGIIYDSVKRNHDKVYIETILKEMDTILCEERSFASDFRWAKTVCVPSRCS